MRNEIFPKAFIFGGADLAMLLQSNLLSLGNHSVEAFVVDRDFKVADTLLGLPVMASERLPAYFNPKEYGCYICLGYSNMNNYRQNIYTRIKELGYKILSFFHPSAEVNCHIGGEGNLVFQNALIDFFTELGTGNILYPGAVIAHHNRIGNFNFFAVSSCVTGHVDIGDNNFIGANATVGNGVVLEDHCLVGAGAYVAKSMKPYEVFVPSRGAILQNKKSTDVM